LHAKSTFHAGLTWQTNFPQEPWIFFLLMIYPYTQVSNMLYVDDTLCKNMFNGPYNAIFLELFDNLCGEDQYLLGSVFLYLENLHSFGYGLPTFVENNPFGRIRCIKWDNPRLLKMLFVKCSWICQPIFCNNMKLK
jgi:hypothetical protein